jgi:hypothetical protein
VSAVPLKRWVAPLLVVLVGGLAAPAAGAKTYTVPAGTADSSSGTCDSAFACSNLRAAVVAADASPGSIQLHAGTYTLGNGAGNSFGTGDLDISAAITINGAGAGQTIIRQTDAANNVFNVQSGHTVAIDDVEITSPQLNGSGPGLVQNQGTLTLDRDLLTGVTVQANFAQDSGPSAILNASGSMTVRDTTISDNQAFGGSSFAGGNGGNAEGAILSSADLTVINSTVSGNVADAGNGGNGTTGNGGNGGNATGGAISQTSRGLTIINSTITGNRATSGNNGFGVASGAVGTALGGGVYVNSGSSGLVVIGSSTVTSNKVSAPDGVSSQGGDMYFNVSRSMIGDTIVSGGVAHTGADCQTNAALTDERHNLEDDTTSQCGFTTAAGDLAPADPKLGDLHANGGPTQTMALLAGSPALGTGGQCPDPNNPGANLTLDQRGLPRTAGACDVGAYEAQPVTAGTPPTVSGTPTVGQTLTCNPGTWGGDGPLALAYQWLNDGASIDGATTTTYTVQDSDRGHQIACSETATGPRGQATQTSTAVSVPAPSPPGGGGGGGGGGTDTTAPVVLSVSASPRTFAVDPNGTAETAVSAKAPRGTTFHYTLSEAARVVFTIERPTAGRKSGKTCVRPTHKNRKKRKCTRYPLAGRFAVQSAAGPSSHHFSGRIGTHKLKPGSYRVTLAATDAAGNRSALHRLTIKIVKK